MTHDEYVARVMAGDYPDDPKVELPPDYKNKAGTIQNLLFAETAGAALITSFDGAVRSNHYHKTDWHFMYVLDGVMEYYWRGVRSESPVYLCRVKPGEMVFTPPLVEHTTRFRGTTRLLVFSRNARKHDDHEADLVRIPPLVGA
jgi:oxalate decarboxylase/phosphoglucose isomerase-like protein (cupin superfamily)